MVVLYVLWLVNLLPQKGFPCFQTPSLQGYGASRLHFDLVFWYLLIQGCSYPHERQIHLSCLAFEKANKMILWYNLMICKSNTLSQGLSRLWLLDITWRRQRIHQNIAFQRFLGEWSFSYWDAFRNIRPAGEPTSTIKGVAKDWITRSEMDITEGLHNLVKPRHLETF